MGLRLSKQNNYSRLISQSAGHQPLKHSDFLHSSQVLPSSLHLQFPEYSFHKQEINE